MPERKPGCVAITENLVRGDHVVETPRNRAHAKRARLTQERRDALREAFESLLERLEARDAADHGGKS